MRMSGGMRRVVTVLIAGAALSACATPSLPLVPASQPASSPAVPGPVREVVIGVDRLAGGFNPHTLADLTPLSTAVAGLLLPSAFHQRPDGQWVLDDTLLTSAEVTDTAPFTVTYRIRHDAQWSDTAPIAAEDFGYLAEQLRTQPGVVDSAGYQLIDQVGSRDGGKTVEVVFRRPYAGWRTLFRHLMPAHLLKDAPGGWPEALDSGLGVSGGPFALVSLDPARGELVLGRNDRYWATPAKVDRIRFREGSDAALVTALRTGAAQGALFGYPDAITELLLHEADPHQAGEPGPPPTTPARIMIVPQPILTSVLLRPASQVLGDQRVRTAVAAALDRPSLIATGAASGPSAALRADSQVLAPAQPGYRRTAPAAGPPVQPDPASVHHLLTAAGYTRAPAGWQRAGQPLKLVVAAPADREPYGVLAARVVEQLRSAGIGATLRLVEPDTLFGTLLGLRKRSESGQPGQAAAQRGSLEPAGTADIVVLPQPAAGHPGTQLASWYGCPLVVPARLTPAPPNLAGLCDLSLQPLIEQALTADNPAGTVAPALEAMLWQRAVTVPLYQQASLLVTTGQLQGVVPGSTLEGPFDGAERWRLLR
ncbi:MAG TPA: ABC transporter family substrate-binding protein [Pseudonocardiaceae bacterium]|nr:ABC transporter family substrate-binding protein [Pseudonocardiaceae bacterium]